MKKILILLLFVLLVLSSAEELNENNIYDEINKEFSEVVNTQNNSNKFLLISSDINRTINVLKNYKKIYLLFSKELNIANNKNLEYELFNLYVNTLTAITNIKVTDNIQVLSRIDYEMRIIKQLKKDLDEKRLSYENKESLLSNIEKLLVLNKQILYDVVKNRNIFYGKNIKKYISITMNSSLEKVSENNIIYQNFMEMLHKGECLVLDSINYETFDELDKFLKDLETTKEDMKYLLQLKNKNPIKFSKQFVNYWIKSRIYIRYIDQEENTISTLKHIEKAKSFFETL